MTQNVDDELLCTDDEIDEMKGKDKKLQKWIHNWEAWQSNVVIFNKKLKQEYQATLTLLQGRAL